ncbi:MAG: DHH family phosphoesterase [Candidatus Blackburnbacteria bacterium]|nr:DHH family phosphoesterase [Candidatus Blackburnbacteria bacterium]
MTVNYSESVTIKEALESSTKVFLALHINPDGDSVGSNLALSSYLKSLGKTVEIWAADAPPLNLDFLSHFGNITNKDPHEADFEKFDLVVLLDSPEVARITRHEHLGLPTQRVVVIDHHETNTKFGSVNLVDGKASSTGEILYKLFEDWGVAIDSKIATDLLTAIAADTGTFRWITSDSTLAAASQLIKYGADLEEVNFNLYNRTPLKEIQYQAEVVRKLKQETSGKYNFVWAATSFPEIKSLGGTEFAVGGSDIAKTIDGVDFALVLREEEKGVMTGSLRSRTQVDVARIASIFGGGGHVAAAGFMMRFSGSFEEKVREVIEKIKDYLKNQ